MPLDHDINEVYLWHGTNVRAALSIAEDNFRLSLAGSNVGTMFGKGIYLTENCTKADEYAKDEPEGYYQGVYAMLLCRATLGKFTYTTQRKESAGDEVESGKFDSVLGDRMKSADTFREFVVQSADQVYPEYIVLYTRTFTRESVEDIEAKIARPLFLEVPIHWSNRGKNPSTTPFYEEFCSNLDHLVNLAEGYEVESIRRVENSLDWMRFVDFKRKLRAQLDAGGKTCCMPISEFGSINAGRPPLTSCSGTTVGIDILNTLESQLNVHLLWHGTSKAAAEAIAKTDFCIRKRGEGGERFGNGAYCAENIAKSFGYAPPENGSQWVLLCRVACGEVFYTEEQQDSNAADKAAGSGKHCVLASPRNGDPREFIVFNADQIYAEYIFELHLEGQDLD
eukprot:gnl/MRDRNA2_/MRDRNA2_48329_c0_seq1.p1 gnl/MRDRNA2_/MRDRNA2_48329_c0~~gnl/MRDRNA2_/MRDRNA2_48329_c0_seq1.p1  ORF type:complete len:436 (+),score=61.62 gnl/MRDRNA2_/MRDRNA2_48329_c0_seq1:124-1308(+)